MENTYTKLDCPYDFTSRCTMGRCDCKPIQKSTRELALEWWNQTELPRQVLLAKRYFNRTALSLIGGEIEKIYIAEHLYCVSSDSLVHGKSCEKFCGDNNCLRVEPKENQNESKQFSEVEFKKFIGDLSHDDKIKAHQILFRSFDYQTREKIIEAIVN
jgi:hypothetical protein